ncbi:MAG: hypothetical protein K9M57_09630 [Phycisphaerae bacterium]|nr:hypothetical protein [Phycisphaerae bacterium]
MLLFCVLAVSGDVSILYGQDAKPAPAAATKPGSSDKTEVVASLFYPELEAKQLFQMLSGLYQVQFQGAEQVVGKMSLISNGKVNLKGMLFLLNEALVSKSMAARVQGEVILIEPVKDMDDSVIKLVNADPQKIVDILKKRFMNGPGAKGDEKVRKPSLIEVHPHQRAVIVQGPKAVVQEMMKYVKEQELDVSVTGNGGMSASRSDVPTVKTDIMLKYASVDQVVKYLQDVYLTDPKGRPEDNIFKVSLITKHPQFGRIVVVGPAPVVAEVIKDVAELDIEPPAPPMYRRFIELKYLAAVEFEVILGKDTTLVDKFISSVAPNNILIISSKDEAIFTKIDELKKKFDVDQKELRYIPLAYADAAKTASLLTAVYTAAKQAPLPAELTDVRQGGDEKGDGRDSQALDMIRESLLGAGVEDPSIADRLSRSISLVEVKDFTIVPDPEHNGLMIYTLSRNFPKLLELIDKLDKPRKQLFIDVYITQVELDDVTDLGVDFTFTGDVERKNETIPFTVQGDLNTDIIKTGLSYQLISDNLTMFMRALQETGKVEVLSRPYITTKDNSKAVFSLGKDVPTLSKLRVSLEGLSGGDVIYKNVATTLTVTPQIHPDNYVTLNIIQDINEISAETYQITSAFDPQVLTHRNATTTVRVRDGQTICLGGFIGEEIVENDRRVPLLSDIPLLGWLFQYSSHKKVKTELIIFITPHILQTPEEMLRMTNEMRKESNAKPNDDYGKGVLQQHDSLDLPRFKEPAKSVD